MQAYLQYRRMGHAVCKRLDTWESGLAEVGDGIQSKGNTSSDITTQRARAQPALPGIEVRHGEDSNEKDSNSLVFLVGWEDESDTLNPRNYGITVRTFATVVVSSLAFIVSASSSILAGVVPQNSAAFGVSDMVASMATGLFLLGFAAGSLISGPLSEVLGRNAIYTSSLTVFMIFTMASGLAPNIGAHWCSDFLLGSSDALH